jgi:RimJ/RimL family protein N-acetyltransferase
MSDPICRLATQKDFPAVAEMYTRLDALMRRMGMTLPSPEDVGQAWIKSFQRTLGRFSFLHVAEIDGELVGFTLSVIKRVPPHRGGVIVGEITDMWINPAARRTRVGEEIARVAIQLLLEQGVHSIEARFLVRNDPVWRLAESLGFHLELRTARLLWEDYVEEDA